jgi:hypothetical protein
MTEGTAGPRKKLTRPDPAGVHFAECRVDGRPIGDLSLKSMWLTNNYVGGTPSDLGSDMASFSVAFKPASVP